MRELSRSRGMTVVGMSVPEGSAGDRLLASLGYFVRWNSWVLQLPEGREIASHPLPAGYTIRTAESEADRRALHDVKEDAFLEWSERDRESFEDFEAQTVGRPGFEPWNLRMVVDPAGECVGVCYLQLSETTGFVSQLATRKDQRGLGLARALLVDAFANAREHGATVSELSTDSRTGALPLYEKVGMVVTSNWVHRAFDLT
jgi:GNAT superfamily N-acetyltransferase